MTARTFTSGYKPDLASLKAHLRIVASDMDTDLTSKLKAAIIHAEHYIGQIIAQSSFTATEKFTRSLKLNGPVISVTSVTVDGVELTSSQFSLADGVLIIVDSVSGENMVVAYSAGMTSVPEDIEAAVMLQASSLFTNPIDSVEILAKASQNLLRPYRTYGL